MQRFSVGELLSWLGALIETDESRRRNERDAVRYGDDAPTVARVWMDRIRSGDMPPGMVQLMADLGDRGARLAMGQQSTQDFDLRRFLLHGHEDRRYEQDWFQQARDLAIATIGEVMLSRHDLAQDGALRSYVTLMRNIALGRAPRTAAADARDELGGAGGPLDGYEETLSSERYNAVLWIYEALDYFSMTRPNAVREQLSVLLNLIERRRLAVTMRTLQNNVREALMRWIRSR